MENNYINQPQFFFASRGKKVLLVDIDPQGNAGSGLGIDINQMENTSYEVLIGEVSATEAIQKQELKIFR